MRRIAPLILLALLWCFFAGSPAEAVSTQLYFFLGSAGTVSYAGGTAPLVGSNIDVFYITPDPLGSGKDLDCTKCTFTFSTGPFAGTFPAGQPGEHGSGYSFAGGGSLQIIGGANFNGAPFLPLGTTLLTGVPTNAIVVDDDIQGGKFDTVTAFGFQGVTLHPELLSFYQFPDGASLGGATIFGTSVGESSAPNPLILSGIGPAFAFSDTHYVVIGATQAVPLPDTFWPFAVSFVALAGWRAWRKAFPL
jgi:hypothetical protein